MSYPTTSRLRGMSLPDLVAVLVAFRVLGRAGAWLLHFMRAWQYACAAQDAEGGVQA